MKPFTDMYNLCAGAVIAIFTTLFGIYWYVFAGYMILNIIDWLTGWYKSRKQKKESSIVGLKGIVKKLGYWIIVAVAFLMSDIFVRFGNDILHLNLEFLMSIGWFTLACLFINEVRSILENLVELGYSVPKVLVDGLEITEKLVNKTAEGSVKDGTDDKTGQDESDRKS